MSRVSYSTDQTRDALIARVLQVVPLAEHSALLGWLEIIGTPPHQLSAASIAAAQQMGFRGFAASERARVQEAKRGAPQLNKQAVHFADSFPPGTIAARFEVGSKDFGGKTVSQSSVTFFHPTEQSFVPVTVSAHPADYPDRPDHVGYLNFISDLMLFIKYEKQIFVPAHKAPEYAAAGFQPTKYNPAAVAEFLGMWGSLLSSGLTAAGLSTAQVFAHLQYALKRLARGIYLTMQTDFYKNVFRVEHEGSVPVLYENGPFEQAVTMDNYKSYPEVHKVDLGYHVARTGSMKDGMRMPKDDDAQVKLLNASRVIRGEDNAGPSLLTLAYKRGLRSSNLHRQVCDTLSLALPHASKPNLVIRAPNKQSAKLVREYLAKREYRPKFMVAYEDRHDFGDSAVLTPTSKDFFIDMVSGAIPTAESGASIMPRWLEQFKKSIPETSGFVLKRKVPPSALPMEGLHCFAFQSSHAYDFIVTTEKSLERTVGVYTKMVPDPDLVTTALLAMQSPDDIRQNQFRDNRAKTVGLQCNIDWGVDLGLNLWTPPVILAKKDVGKIKVYYESSEPTSRKKANEIVVQASPGPPQPQGQEVQGLVPQARPAQQGAAQSPAGVVVKARAQVLDFSTLQRDQQHSPYDGGDQGSKEDEGAEYDDD